MKKLLVLLAIAIVLFVGCEPTTGGGGSVLPQEWSVYDETTINEVTGVTEVYVWYVLVTYADSSKTTWLDRDLFQISTSSDKPGTFMVTILREKKQSNPLGALYWKGYSISTSGNERVTDMNNEFTYNYSTEQNEYGRHNYRITDEFNITELDKIKNADTLSVALTGSSSANSASLTIPRQFIEEIKINF